MHSVLPILEASSVQHQMHLSLETLEAPPSAVADIIFKTTEEIDAQLLVLGANRKPVQFPETAHRLDWPFVAHLVVSKL